MALPNPDQEVSTHQLLITVPKRNHKTAVARNKLKRRIREAYRLNKQELDTEEKLLIAYIYTAKESLDYGRIEKKTIAALKKLNAEYHEKKNEKV